MARCVHNDVDAAAFRTWSAKLAGLRWEMITKFCAEVPRWMLVFVAFWFSLILILGCSSRTLIHAKLSCFE